MTPVEALKIALSKEIEAIQLYEGFIRKYPEIKDLLLSLLNEEYKHQRLIEKKIQEITKY